MTQMGGNLSSSLPLVVERPSLSVWDLLHGCLVGYRTDITDFSPTRTPLAGVVVTPLGISSSLVSPIALPSQKSDLTSEDGAPVSSKSLEQTSLTHTQLLGLVALLRQSWHIDSMDWSLTTPTTKRTQEPRQT